ncbi:MAG: penicillin-binding transpeptidase domain-containing protein, partial [Patescibacteria group bacterium]|nr:penicillin-binding transpeptidase domain-containing protein [Patescibacteria group bacterium]
TRGVESAAQVYFGKNVSELTLIESAILAGLPQRPSYYSPFTGDKDAYIMRTEAVLRRMREDGYITKEQEDQTVAELPNVKFAERGANFKAPHFVQYVQRILEDKYGASALESGLRVTTTLDLALQEDAQKIVSEEINKVKHLKITNGAAIVLNPETGEILAMVGSRGFDDPEIDGQVNVTTALRQPGSAIKPIVYVTGFKKGYTAATLLMDVQTEFTVGGGQPPYVPVNYDGKYRGPIQVRYALGNSINVPAVKMVALVGVRNMLETAYDMGIKSLEPTQKTLSRVGLSVALGGGEVRLIELTSAYGAFTNGGYRVDPVAILKVEDVNGKVLEEVRPQKSARVLTPEEAYLIADILSDNDARKDVFGVNSQLNIPGRQIAVKTGTTNDKRDNWTVGGNQQVMVGVWVGNNDNSPMTQVASGVTGASPIWRKILLKALDGKPGTKFEVPSGIVNVSVDKVSGYLARDDSESRMEKFIKGTEPQEDKVRLRLKVCKNEGKLANPSDIASGNYEEREYFLFKEEDPTAPKGSGINKWQEGINKWIASQPDPAKYNPPTEYCSSSVPINVEFVRPTDKSSNLPNTFSMEAKIFSIDKISEVTLEIDGVKLRSFTSPPYKEEVNLPDGVHTLRIKARDVNGKESDRVITVGVGVEWNATNTPTSTPTSAPN